MNAHPTETASPRPGADQTPVPMPAGKWAVAWFVLRWSLILLPAALTVRLVALNAVNLMLWDDWLFGAEWVRFLEGKLDWRELFGVHMEHRQVLARAFSLGLHQLFGGDVRAQNGITLVCLAATAGMMLWLLRRTVGPLRGANTWLAFALMVALFSPVQWQTLLWAITFALFLSMALFAAALVPWFSRLSEKAAFPLSFFFALLDTVAFANGLLVWLLVPLAIVFSRPQLAWRKRGLWLGLWVLGGVVVLTLYFHNFNNTVNAAYAYGQGAENTLAHSAQYALAHPGKFVLFVATALGGNLCRGLPVENMAAATGIGLLCLGLGAVAVARLAGTYRRDGGTQLAAGLPWLLLCGFSVGTAVMLALGRMWIGAGLPQAITARYTTHAVFLTASLPVLLVVAGHRWIPRPAIVGTAALAGLLALQSIQWCYGARMMEVWRNSRYADLALTRFCGLLPDGQAFGVTAGDGAFGCQVARDLNRLGLLDPPLLPDRRLANLKVSERTLPSRLAAFTAWETEANGKPSVSGYSVLSSGRPVDLILFTQEVGGEEEIVAIFPPAVTTNSPIPAPRRDYEFTRLRRPDKPVACAWSGHPYPIREILPDQPIRAYAYDAEHNKVFRIPDERADGPPVLRPRNR